MQRQGVAIARRWWKLNTFQAVDDDVDRADTVEVMTRAVPQATGGQGHCHTLSSVMVMFPWSLRLLLGIT